MPCAMLAVIGYVVSTVYAIAFLVRRDLVLDAKSAVSATLGFWFTLLATVTGMVFAKLQWGAAWNWDPRETSILMLLIVYSGYFALRGAIPGRDARGRVSAVYNAMACIVMPYLVFVLPRIVGGLHPTRAHLSVEYRIAMLASAVGLVCIYVLIFRTSVRKAERQIIAARTDRSQADPDYVRKT